ncbi:MAG TPA: DUF692 family protein [Thermoanaerobaculia bacterium]
MIGTNFVPDVDFLERILGTADVLEIPPDVIASHSGAIDEDAMAMLDEVAAHARLIVHGVGLSIGSADGWNDDYLRLLDALFARLPIAWHSEHLGYTTVAGESLGTMLVLPRVEESLDLLCPRIEAIQRRYGVPFLVEHVVNLLPEPPEADYSPAAFLNELVRRTGCGLLLDVYNLQCDVHNHALDVGRFLDELQFDAVREIHVANGVERDGVLLDIHSRALRDDTRALLAQVRPRATNAEAVIFELVPEAVPVLGHEAIAAELERLA